MLARMFDTDWTGKNRTDEKVHTYSTCNPQATGAEACSNKLLDRTYRMQDAWHLHAC